MGVSKKAKSEDAAHIRRFKKLSPKARFKTLSKSDQFVVTARALSGQLPHLRSSIGGSVGNAANGCHITLRSIGPRYIERCPKTGFLTNASSKQAKRAIADAFKNSIGRDTQFMFVIEQQDKDGNPCDPHVHALVNQPFGLGVRKSLRQRLCRVADDNDGGVVEVQTMTQWRKRHNELAPAEASYRRAAEYSGKNDRTLFYRSKSLIIHVPTVYEDLKKHYGTAP